MTSVVGTPSFRKVGAGNSLETHCRGDCTLESGLRKMEHCWDSRKFVYDSS